MKRKTNSIDKNDILIRHLQNIQIILLGMIGVPQQDIRKIIGGDLNKVTAIVQHIVKAKRNNRK